ncbi:MAG: hypothetical protein KJ687_09610 [Proteobacteria bacterium]|nr:hypothetical protein [Pseudomonadota bacterium]
MKIVKIHICIDFYVELLTILKREKILTILIYGERESHMTEQKEVQEGKIFAVLSYLWILCFIPLLFKKENKFALFHAKQGLVLFICEIALWIVGIIPVLGWLISIVGSLICGIFALIGIIQALMGNEWKMPVLGDYAEKINV